MVCASFFFCVCVHAWPAAAVLIPLLSRCVDSSSSCFVKFSACHCFQFSLRHMFWCRKKKKILCTGCMWLPSAIKQQCHWGLCVGPAASSGPREERAFGGRGTCVLCMLGRLFVLGRWGPFACWGPAASFDHQESRALPASHHQKRQGNKCLAIGS